MQSFLSRCSVLLRLLKACHVQTGMPKKVRTLVDLEALLNDGTAYVLFKLLQVAVPPVSSH